MKVFFLTIGVLLCVACMSTTNRDEASQDTVTNRAEALQDAAKANMQLTGTYGYGPGADKGPTGTISVFPHDDNTVLFGIDLSVGPPSYNMGALFDTLTIDKSGHQGQFEHRGYGDRGCRWQVTFHGDSLTIETLDGANECGFGNAVSAAGTYQLIDRNPPQVYTDQVGDTIYRLVH